MSIRPVRECCTSVEYYPQPGFNSENCPAPNLTTEEKKKRLVSVKKKLKKTYRGIDKQIDTLVDNIASWYLGTATPNRPTIVNMWSMTGLGKTSLVRLLMQELGVSDKLIEITMTNETSNNKYQHTVLGQVTNVVQGARNNLCIFVDEFQNMQTITKEGESVKDTPYQDLWTLLSDGRFYTREEYLKKIDSLFSSAFDLWEMMHRHFTTALDTFNTKDAEQTYGYEKYKQLQMWINRMDIYNGNDSYGTYPITCSNNIESMFEFQVDDHHWKEDYSVEDMLAFIKDLCEISKDNSIYLTMKVNMDFELEKLQKRFKGIFFKSLKKGNYASIINQIKEQAIQLSRTDIDSALQAKNLLVIIAGNQDTLFKNSKDFMFSYKDVDYVHEVNSKLKWYDLKQVLLDSLRPEQISRLGMVHLIYPTLTKKAYNQIIKDHINILSSTAKKQYKCNITFSKEFISMVYKNGVFPTQGVRPLLSLLDSMIGGLVYEICGYNKGKNISFTIDEKTKELIATVGKNTIKKKLLLEVSEKEEDCGGKFRLRAAIHEAGHALVFMYKVGIAPTIDMAPLSTNAGAWTRTYIPEEVEQEIGMLHEYMLSDIAMTLGGREAESIVFGERLLSAGCYCDLQEATSLSLRLARRYGYRGSGGNGVSSNSSESSISAANSLTVFDESIQTGVAELLKDAAQEANAIITTCKPVMVEMVEYLMKNVYMDENKSKEFLSKVNKIRKEFGDITLGNYKSQKDWETFKK